MTMGTALYQRDDVDRLYANCGARGVMVIVVGNGLAIRVQSWTRLFSFHIAPNIIEKGMNPTILPPAMDR